MKTRLLGGAALVAVAMGFASPAFADLDSYVTGGHAWRSATKQQVSIRDTLGDGQGVYAKYRRSGDTADRRINSTGYGSTATTGSSGKAVNGLKACENVQAQPDRCDSWHRG